MVYYNEIDPKAAAWLRALITAGEIPDGEVDTRSIVDVRPADLVGFRQCHFFAGIGGWAYALRLAGWPDDREVWTGSCPCQPWSVAGSGKGADDPRHLWPTWFPLIRERRPCAIFGEQTSSLDGRYWLDLVLADLEGIDYAVGAFDLPAAGAGAPHARQRLWIVGHTDRSGCETRDVEPSGGSARSEQLTEPGASVSVADTEHTERRPLSGSIEDVGNGRNRGRSKTHGESGARRQVLNVADTTSRGQRTDGRSSGQPGYVNERGAAGAVGDAGGSGLQGLAGHGDDGHQPGRLGALEAGSVTTASGASFWSACDWIPCTDGKARPAEPGTFPLAYGLPARVGRLRGYGNAIVPEVAALVIRAYMSVSKESPCQT